MNSANKFRQMWHSTARKANRIAIIPLALPSWTKILRLCPAPKASVKDLLEVKCFERFSFWCFFNNYCVNKIIVMIL